MTRQIKFQHDTTYILELITLTSALNYQLRMAEETRKRISEISLKLKHKRRK